MVTRAPSSLPPRIRLGTGRKPSPVLARQTLVSHSIPSIEAWTGVRAQARVMGGVNFLGTLTYVHPPLPGMRRSVVLKRRVVAVTAIQSTMNNLAPASVLDRCGSALSATW